MKRLVALGAVCLFVLESQAALQLSSSFEDIPERGPVERVLVSSPMGRFAVIPPAGWRLENRSSENTLVLVSDKLEAAFTLRFSLLPVPATEKELQKYCASQWPDAQELEFCACTTRDQQGQAVEFVSTPRGLAYRTRLGFTVAGQGGIEFRLTSPDANFSRAHLAWITVLNSFTASP